jgi:cbb3-type cytochrome oxidase subunit 1
MRGIALWFLVSAIIYVLVGMSFGIWMAANQDFQLAPMHGHLNLIGWVTMALFALFYHQVPQAAEGSLPKLHFVIATLSIWLMVPGIAMALTGQGETLAKIGSVGGIITMLIFLTVVLRSRQPAKSSLLGSPSPAE